MDDLRQAFRRLVRHRGAAIGSIVTLGGAIGAAVATWSLLWALLLDPLPVRDPSSLYVAAAARPSSVAGPPLNTAFVYPAYQQVRDAGVFADVAGAWLSPWPFSITEQGGTPPAFGVFVSGNFFELLGVRIPLGRALNPADDRRGVPPVAVISDRFWRGRLGASPDVLGRVLTLDRGPVTIVGVTAPSFRGLSLASAPDLYLPLETSADVGPPSFNYFAEPGRNSPTAAVTIVGRIRSGENAEQVASRLSAVPALMAGQNAARAIPLTTLAVPPAARENMTHFARLLVGTVALLLLIGCSTVGMLLLVRTDARRAELATRLALGASRGRLVWSVVLEAAILCGSGAALAPIVSGAIFVTLSTYQLPGGINLGLLGLRFDIRALLAALTFATTAIALVTAVAGALAPRAQIIDLLRSQTGSTPRLGRRSGRAALLALQVGITLALAAGAGLFARSLMRVLDLNARFESDRIATTDIRLQALGYSSERAQDFFTTLAARATALPAVADLATSVNAGGMSARGNLTIDGESRQFPYTTAFRYVDHSYFRAMRMRILRGRGFSENDRPDSPQVGIVSESFGRMIAAGGDPLGRHIVTMMGSRLDVEIVGVTEDLFTTVRDEEPLTLYMPIAQNVVPAPDRTLTFRAAGDVNAAWRDLAALLKNAEPRLDPARPMTLDDRLLREMAPQQFARIVLGTLGSLALVLTSLGIYVLAESAAVARTREIAIRAALGASRQRLLAVIVRDAAVIVSIGIAAGVFIAWAAAGTLRALLFRVQPLDPWTLSISTALIMALALLVSLRPALRASRLDLASVLRAD